MPKSKRQRFRDINRFPNVLELTDFQNNHKTKPKGKWKSEIFQNRNPLTLELACGKGDYTLGLARMFPNRNCIGIDIKGARIWKGAKKALEEGLSNVRFLRIYIDHLDEYFAYEEVEEIWITFPDPYPRQSDRNKRLVSAKFLNIYRQVLKPGSSIHFKTDSDKLYSFAKKSIPSFGCTVKDISDDIYAERADDKLLTIKTDYEKRHLKEGKSIKYIRFTLP